MIHTEQKLHTHASSQDYRAQVRVHAREQEDQKNACLSRCRDTSSYLGLLFVPSIIVILLASPFLQSMYVIRFLIQSTLLSTIIAWVWFEPIHQLYERILPDTLEHIPGLCSWCLRHFLLHGRLVFALFMILISFICSMIEISVLLHKPWWETLLDDQITMESAESNPLYISLWVSTAVTTMGLASGSLLLRTVSQRLLVYRPPEENAAVAEDGQIEPASSIFMEDETPLPRPQRIPGNTQTVTGAISVQIVSTSTGEIDVPASLQQSGQVLENTNIVTQDESSASNHSICLTLAIGMSFLFAVGHVWLIWIPTDMMSTNTLTIAVFFLWFIIESLLIAYLRNDHHTRFYDIPSFILILCVQVPFILWMGAWFVMAYTQGQLDSPSPTDSNDPQFNGTLVIHYAGFLCLAHTTLLFLQSLIARASAPSLYRRYLFPSQVWVMTCQVCIFGFTPWSWQLGALFGLTLVQQLILVTNFHQRLWKWFWMNCFCCCRRRDGEERTVAVTTARYAALHILETIGEMETYFQETLARIQSFVGIPLLIVWFRTRSEEENQQAFVSTTWSRRFLADGSLLASVIGVQFIFHCLLWIVSYRIFKRRVRNVLTHLQEICQGMELQERQPLIGLFRQVIDMEWNLGQDPFRRAAILQALENEHPVLFLTDLRENADQIAERLLHWHRWFPSNLRKNVVYFVLTTTLVYLGLFMGHLSCPLRFVFLGWSCGF